MQSFATLRNRLTLLYTGVLAGLSLATAVILYVAIWYHVEATSAESLRISAVQLANAYELSIKNSESGSVNLESIIESLSESSTGYRIWNQNFEVVKSSGIDALDEKTGFYLVQRFFHNGNGHAEMTDFDSGPDSFKVCTDAFVDGSGDLIMVQLVKNMSTQRQMLEGPALIVFGVILSGVLLSFVAGNYLAKRALEPIKKSYDQQMDFLADASHELRTPVAVVLANLEALQSHPDQTVASQSKWVENAYSEIKRTKAVVEDMLFLAKADAGESITPNMSVVDLSYLVLQVTERLEGLADKKNVALITDVKETELLVLGDENRLSELLTILIDNGVKYTNGNGKVEVVLSATEDKVKLEVRDNGIGIAKSEQSKIFERFYRVDKARSRQEGGTGLGLSIAQLIIKEHGIDLKLMSKEGKGTTFTLLFNRVYPTDRTEKI